MAQEKTDSMVTPIEDNRVRPYETVKVYSTGKSKHSPEGTEMEVHPLLAEKLIAAGKVSKDKPKSK